MRRRKFKIAAGVCCLVLLLVSVLRPRYDKVNLRSREVLLKNTLFTLRTVIDEYKYDKQKPPTTLDELVANGYLRSVPVDPMTKSSATWRIEADERNPGIKAVHSGSDLRSLDGRPYSEW